ncbi:DUF58 domain-containing protein [Amycolatopsis sp. NPDC059657]|uniref:DUF58 domain-containing protein n=1 Tax=Amycolatopsis sp. NPDC059657 TaxID=3346899 RepID=UPI00366F7744
MRFTRRGWAVAASAPLAYGIGEWAGYPLFRALAGIALGALLAAVLTTFRRPDVTVRRELEPDHVERGTPALARLLVSNNGDRRQPGFTARERVERGEFVTVAVRPLSPEEEVPYHYELPTSARGKLTVGPLVLERSDPFGLLRRPLPAGDTATLWVRPKVRPARSWAGGHPRHHHEGPTTDDALRGSADLRDVRPYVLGDEVRHLHWKATARTGRLMVRDYVDPDQPRFTLMLDTRPKVLSDKEFEEAVDVAASLVTASTMAGHRCRMLTSAGRDLPTSGGAHAARQLLDVLCEVQQAPGVLALPKSGSEGGCLVVVTGRLREPDLRELAALRPRFASMVLLGVGTHGLGMQGLGVHGVDGVPGARAISAVDAGEAVRRWNAIA